MTQMNQIILEGNVVRDCTIRQTPRGTRVCTVPLATNHRYKDYKGEYQTDVGFFDVEVWGEKFTNLIAKEATKGRGLRVVGRLKQNRWKGQDGKSTSKVFIVAEHIEFKFPSPAKKNDDDSKTDLSIAREGLAEEINEQTENIDIEAASETEVVF